MKLIATCLVPLLFASCASTGFFRTVPVDRKGGWSEFQFRVLEAPPEWNQDVNPLNKPGDDDYETSVAKLHRGNLREITSNPAYDLFNALQETP